MLWRALERAIPDIRARTEVKLVGTPLTHARYLNRHEGTYGAAISAANGSFPGPQTPIPGLFRCGCSRLCAALFHVLRASFAERFDRDEHDSNFMPAQQSHHNHLRLVWLCPPVGFMQSYPDRE